MKVALALFALACIAVSPAICNSQTADYQTGKIISVEKLDTAGSSGGVDAPVASNTAHYNLGIQLGDTLYTCRAKTSGDIDLGWVQGKEVQAKADGKVMYVKRVNGKIARLSIVSSKKSN
jgi:hypothetical protein